MKIEYGYCHCGCGQKTKTADRAGRGQIKGEPMKFIHGHNARGKNHYSWNGGRIIRKGRYIGIKNPDHPRADSQGYVKEHILIAEKALGKPLPERAVVHHHSPTELVICEDQKYHLLIEQRKRAYVACGETTWRKCLFCKIYDDPSKMIKHANGLTHVSCRNKYKRDHYYAHLSTAHLEEAAGRL